MADTPPKGPFKLVSVNTVPERAFRLIGRVAEALGDRYTIVHAANCESEWLSLLCADGFSICLCSFYLCRDTVC